MAALDPVTAQEMMNKLAEDRATYLETLNRAHELLAQALVAAGSGKPTPKLTIHTVRRSTADSLDTAKTFDTVGTLETPKTFDTKNTLDVDSIQKTSAHSFEDYSDTDDDESLFVQQTLPSETYDEEGLRRHILGYDWTQAGRDILGDTLNDKKLLQRSHVFPQTQGPVTDRSNLTHYSIFDVGNDGAPLEIMSASDKGTTSRAQAIWNNLKEINANPDRQRLAVGRITIVREPSPLLFAALHYTMSKHFDVDEMFQLLVDLHTKVRGPFQ